MTRANRRVQLMRIARSLVNRDGMSALTMMALAERAKVAKPVVYSHFPNRSAVAIALLDEHFVSLTQFVLDRVSAASDSEDYFDRLIDASFEFESSSDTPVRKITNGFSAGDEVNNAFLKYAKQFQRQWETILIQLGVKRESARVAAYALSTLTDSIVFTFSVPWEKKAARDMARDTLKKILQASIHALSPKASLHIPHPVKSKVLPSVKTRHTGSKSIAKKK